MSIVYDRGLFVESPHSFLSAADMDVEQKYDALCAHMKEVLDAKPVDYDEVKSTAGNILALHRSFPKDLRFQIWEVLLDVAERVVHFGGE